MYNFFSDQDTISSISTPIGEGAIGIVRLSGHNAVEIADLIFCAKRTGKKLKDSSSHKMIFGDIADPETGFVIDEVLVSVMRSPNTYTREDIVEINCHGGPVPLRLILELTLKNGARLSEPGEFTKRAFLNGRLDLTQTEAVLDIINAKSNAALQLANSQLKGGLSSRIKKNMDILTSLLMLTEASIDFTEEDIEIITYDEMEKRAKEVIEDFTQLLDTASSGKLIREGVTIPIIGRPNTGKSSLLNALLGEEKAIVTELPGTTRDLISDYIQIKGIPVKLFDTAGIRASADPIEIEGIKRAKNIIENAHVIIFLIDSSAELTEEDIQIAELISGKKVLAVFNKCDITPVLTDDKINKLFPSFSTVKISAKNRIGLDELKQILYDEVTLGKDTGSILLTNARHEALIRNCLEALNSFSESLMKKDPPELLAFHLKDAVSFLGLIIGTVTSDDILNRIFDNFCIGK